ncbi:hypothetical protein K7X08_003921 [Anisodus acutangulus]|uniref:Uncharacterized protein n=1 Tax=Anisodus acutangulus TaxID=402998 RepID=A0A9Q1MJP9_9SOLA|nr:hypothetical protein K7X08_003921 [Anisodus acutangulus]
MQASPMVSTSSSFTRYSNTNLTEISARVVEEFRAENETQSGYFLNHIFEKETEKKGKDENHENQVNEDDDFEFAFVTTGSDQFSSISADEIFYNGQIRPINTMLKKLTDLTQLQKLHQTTTLQVSITPKSIQVPLRKLFIEDREIASSSEGDDLDGIPPGTYCVWKPRAAEESLTDQRCKKSNSTGSSSKRWKLRDFLHRSNIDGKETRVFDDSVQKERRESREDEV